jgi:hypothetical protein
MSRLVPVIAICSSIIWGLNGHAAGSANPVESSAYSDAFLRGAEHACEQTERAITRIANMLQARCVAADMRAGKDATYTSLHCFGARQRRGFVKTAEEVCGNA